MPLAGFTRTHHCPKKSKGNYRLDKKKGFCTEHNMKCPTLGCNWVHLLNQECSRCARRDEYGEKGKDKEKDKKKGKKRDDEDDDDDNDNDNDDDNDDDDEKQQGAKNGKKKGGK